MKRGVACVTAEYDVNLTEYLLCFTAFDADYDSLKTVDAITKAKKTYQKTVEFLDHIKKYPELNIIRMQLKEINEYFAVQLAIKTKNVIKLFDDVDSKTTNRYSLAKLALNNIDGFLNSIERAINDFKIVVTQLTTKTLDTKAKLDEVDNTLLQSERIDLSFQDKLVGGYVNINARTYRPTQSLLSDGYLKSVKTTSGKEEEAIIERFNKFIFMVRENNKKIGFVPTESQQSEAILSKSKISIS